MEIREFHLFAGIGGGIYGGKLLGHSCVGSVEIDAFCQKVLKQRQQDGWMDRFPIFDDIRTINGKDFINDFDVLCGGFPCQAFSSAARGRNIKEKDLWDEMFRFIKDSNAPIVFAENVALKALKAAEKDLNNLGYKTSICKLSCYDLGGNHRRNRYWLMAVNNFELLINISNKLYTSPKIIASIWKNCIYSETPIPQSTRNRLKSIGNAQVPFVAAIAFKVLVNRILTNETYSLNVSKLELDLNFIKTKTWINKTYGEEFGLIHTPTTMANYSAPSMMKHKSCQNFIEVFGVPTPSNAEYLMGFPSGASSPEPKEKLIFDKWLIESLV